MENYYLDKYRRYRQQYFQTDNFIYKVKYKKYKAKYKEVRQEGAIWANKNFLTYT